MTDDIALNQARLDWLRLTSYEFGVFEHLTRTGPDDKKSTKRLNYRGHTYDGIFVGSGHQAGRAHFMAEQTGGRAHDVYTRFPESGRCRRIDLQVTLSAPWSSIGIMAEQLRRSEWKGSGRRREIEWRSRDSIEDTLSVGARTGARYVRIYAKGTRQEQLVRFEIEFKKDYAPGIWSSVNEGITIAELLAREIWQFPQVSAMQPFHAWASEWDSIEDRAVFVKNSRRRWIEATLLPALWKQANAHEDSTWLLSELRSVVDYMSTKY